MFNSQNYKAIEDGTHFSTHLTDEQVNQLTHSDMCRINDAQHCDCGLEQLLKKRNLSPV